jgi:hypothetical protein
MPKTDYSNPRGSEFAVLNVALVARDTRVLLSVRASWKVVPGVFPCRIEDKVIVEFMIARSYEYTFPPL